VAQWLGKGAGFENWPCPWRSWVVWVMERVGAWDWAMEAVERVREVQGRCFA
jgi:hypothetical protein